MKKTVIIKRTRLPEFLPHGWKKEVALALGIHPNSVTNALRNKSGFTYEKIKKVAIEKWGDQNELNQKTDGQTT